MKKTITAYLNYAICFLLTLVAFLIPIIFAPLTTEFFDTPKLVFLMISVLLMLVLWTLSWVVQGKVTLKRTPLDLPLIVFLFVIILSTIFSHTKYTAIFGNLTGVSGSAATWISYVLLYFIAVSNLRSLAQISAVKIALVSSTVLVSVVSLLSYFGIYLPFQFTQTVNFTPTGSAFAASVLPVLCIPIALLHYRALGILIAALFGITVVLLGNFITIGAAFIGLLSTILIFKGSLSKHLNLVLLPLVVSIFVLVLGYIPNNSPLEQKRIQFPKEIQLPFITSWKISASAFRDSPFLGTGPASYLFDFTAYKPVDFNMTKYWNLRFDSAFNEYLQVLATLGGLGLSLFIYFSGAALIMALRAFTKNSNSELSIICILGILLLFFHTAPIVVMVFIFLALAMLAATSKDTAAKEEFTIGIKISKLTDSNLVTGDVLPIILTVATLTLSIFLFWFASGAVRADFHHRQALNAADENGRQVYNQLTNAKNLNPYIDLYRTDLALTNLALANSIALLKGPTPSSPSGSFTDQDKQNIRQLIAQAIQEGRAATILNPRSAQNWEILGSIYKQISGVAQNALNFSLDAYGRAIQLDLFNPNLRLIVGGIYYSIGNYDMAVRFFTDAVYLKPDFANAYFNLSIALREKGALKDAQKMAEKVVALLDPNSPDYQAAADYLSDLKARIATGSANEQEITPPAVESKGVLQDQKLPKVLDLPKPEKIATPPAVQK